MKPVSRQQGRYPLRQPGLDALQQFLLHRKADIALRRPHPSRDRQGPPTQAHRHHQDFVHIVDVALIHLKNDRLAALSQATDHLQRVGLDRGVDIRLVVLQLPFKLLVAVMRRANLARQSRRHLHQVGAANLKHHARQHRQALAPRLVIQEMTLLEIVLDCLNQNRQLDQRSLQQKWKILESHAMHQKQEIDGW